MLGVLGGLRKVREMVRSRRDKDKNGHQGGFEDGVLEEKTIEY